MQTPNTKIETIRTYARFAFNHKKHVPLLLEYASYTLDSLLSRRNQPMHRLVFCAELKLLKIRYRDAMSWFLYAFSISTIVIGGLICYISKNPMQVSIFVITIVIFLIAVSVIAINKLVSIVNFDSPPEHFTLLGLHPDEDTELDAFWRMALFCNLLELIPETLPRGESQTEFLPTFQMLKDKLIVKHLKMLAEQDIDDQKTAKPLKIFRRNLESFIDLIVELDLMKGTFDDIYRLAYPKTEQ